ncbi:neprosin family prolyl endopeptidase [Symbioplanes lichenis]|uniref:neprosin family prolyl endopeptidase n=1 Tax=Symbioplanes lichenis TaxID=1629072 RepID=UPI0027396585|nr:neprosin family prolyl endopeptidase [Actinoplanes lichenis]
MPNNRRGLLAAGLAAAVVGATGVVWTLNASAAEPPVPSVSAPIVDAAPVPPALLPWGVKPSKLKRGKPGATSKAVAAAGADAAPADRSGSLLPVPEFGPKGKNSKNGPLREERTDVQPPAPPSAEPKAQREVFYHYAYGKQVGATDGSWANIHIAKPELAEEDYHSLAEIALQSEDGKQIVEIGWTVDRGVNGDADPHLFVFSWQNGVAGCYNACGFVQYSKTVKPGDTLPVEGQKRFGIQHASGVWWVAYNSEWIGYFPDKLWDGTYTRGGLTQWFGEVAASSEKPCTQMGNGLPAKEDWAARIGTISMINGPEPKATLKATSPYYSVDWRSDRTFGFGGKGWCGEEDDEEAEE